MKATGTRLRRDGFADTMEHVSHSASFFRFRLGHVDGAIRAGATNLANIDIEYQSGSDSVAHANGHADCLFAADFDRFETATTGGFE